MHPIQFNPGLIKIKGKSMEINKCQHDPVIPFVAGFLVCSIGIYIVDSECPLRIVQRVFGFAQSAFNKINRYDCVKTYLFSVGVYAHFQMIPPAIEYFRECRSDTSLFP